MEDHENDAKVEATAIREKPGVVFWSIHWSRVIAGVILVVKGRLDFHYLGYYIGDFLGPYTGTGRALIPGGPSFFWLIGMPILVIGGILVLYSLLSPIKYEFTFETGAASFDARGKWFLYTWTYHVPSVTSIVYQRHRIGPKAWWIMFFVFSIVESIQYGIGIFDLQHSVANTLPIMMLLTAACDAVVLVVLVFFMQSSLRVSTADRVYEFWVSCPPRNDVLYTYFVDRLFPASSTTREQENMNTSRIITGITLFAGSLLSLFAKLLFGEWLAMIGVMYGIMLVLEGSFLDIKQKVFERETGGEATRFKMHHRQNALNYRLDITDRLAHEEASVSEIPAWHYLFIAYLLGNIAMQITYGIRFGAFLDPLSLANFIASIAYGSLLGIEFFKLTRQTRLVLLFFLSCLAIGVILGACL
jgi:hypothetical protein